MEQWFVHVPNTFIYFLFSYYSSYTLSLAQEFLEFQKESGVGMVDYSAVTEAVKSSSKKSSRKESYTHWSNKERLTIGKYAAENGHAATVRKFSSKKSL